nr:hypothetical protein [Tanacetum cinerariifolium]
MAVIRNNLGWKVKDFKGMTFKEVEEKFNSVCKQMEDFIPMGSKEEAERIKRKGINLEQESSKKQKSSKEITEEPSLLKKFRREDLLKHLDMEDLNQLWKLVKETLSTRPPTSDKEMKLWVELNRLYEPDEADQLVVPPFDVMLVPQGEGSGTLTEPHHTPSPEAQTPSHTTQPTSSLPPVSTTSIPTVTPTETTPIRHYTRRTRIAQSSIPPTVADEPASLQRDGSQREACPTDSGFIADQDRATIAKSSTLPYDSAPRAQEVEILKLKERVKVLEDKEGVSATRSGDDAPIKGRNAATVLAGGIDDVPTDSGSIPTACPPTTDIPTGSDVVPTASLVFATAIVVTPYSRRKGKKVMVESETLKKQRLQEQIDAQVARELEEKQEREDKRMTEQIARDQEVAQIHAKEELQSMIDGLDRNNETIAKYLQEYQQFAAELPLERRIEMISDLESSKKLKSSEEVIEEAKSTAKIPEEKIKEMMQLIPIKEVYVEAL